MTEVMNTCESTVGDYGASGDQKIGFQVGYGVTGNSQYYEFCYTQTQLYWLSLLITISVRWDFSTAVFLVLSSLAPQQSWLAHVNVPPLLSVVKIYFWMALHHFRLIAVPFIFVLIAPKANLIWVCSLIKTRWIQIAPCELGEDLKGHNLFRKLSSLPFLCACAWMNTANTCRLNVSHFFLRWKPTGRIFSPVWPTGISVPIPIIYLDLRSLYLSSVRIQNKKRLWLSYLVFN